MSDLIELDEDLLSFYKENGGDCKHVAFLNPKGGCGKSTLCCNVATHLSHYPNKRVAAIDLDIGVATTTMTLMSRNEYLEELREDGEDMSKFGNPIHVFNAVERTSEELKALILSTKDYDYCFYDCGGFTSGYFVKLASYVDLLICPVMPDKPNFNALEALKHVINSANANRLRFGGDKVKVLAILNRLSPHPNSIRNRQAKDLLDKEMRSLSYSISKGEGIIAYEDFQLVMEEYLSLTEIKGLSDERPVRLLHKFCKAIDSILKS